MRLKRVRWSSWAAWLGVVALALNALVPVHLAFDLAEVLGATPPNESAPGWALLAKLSGHQVPAHQDDHDHHHPPHCPVCSALGALGGLAPATPPRLLAPPRTAGAPAVLQSEERFSGSVLVAYRSRAPPTAA